MTTLTSLDRSPVSPSSLGQGEHSTSSSPHGDSLGSRRCLICNARSDSAHFGVDSCRACAAFFRRTVTMKKKYICRQGTDRCDINKDIRYMCRKCRYRKCLSIGMLPENVQTKSKPGDGNQLNTIPPQSVLPSIPSTSTADPIWTTLGTPSDYPSEQEQLLFNGLPKPDPLMPSQFPRIVEMNLLNKISEQYKIMNMVRRTTEISHGISTMKDVLSGPAQETYRLATLVSINSYMKMLVSVLADFANATFEQFSTLTDTEKWTVLQNFINTMYMLDGSYRTVKVFPGNRTRLFVTLFSYLDTDLMENFFDGAPETLDRKNATQSIRINVLHMLRIMLPNLERANLSEMEYMALLGLAFWPPSETLFDESNHAQATQRISDIGIAIRSQLFHELHVYYRDMLHMEEYSGRLGDIFCLLTCTQGCVSRMKEDLEIYRLFNIFDMNSVVYDVVKEGLRVDFSLSRTTNHTIL